MGYQAKKNSNGSKFKILYEYFDAGVRKSRSVPRDRWLTDLGITAKMTMDEVKVRLGQLNAQDHIKRTQEKRQRVLDRLDQEATEQYAYMPQPLVEEFERERLFGRFSDVEQPKLSSYWRACKRIICEVQLEPSDWADRKTVFYDCFSRNYFSTAYVQKLLRVLNQWGRFICKKQGQFFEPIPAPRGRERQRIADKNLRKAGKKGNRVSEPLSFSLLESKKDSLKIEVYNWLYIATAFGLRPHEVDGLFNREHPYRIWEQDGTQILDVYQSKLQTIDEEERWKSIPAILPEQKRALVLIQSKVGLVHPGPKTMKKVFGDGYTGYCGRNNFIPMMFDKGRRIEEVSQWMGHKDVETTWGYFQKLKKKKLIFATA
jgi:hypothetical protein